MIRVVRRWLPQVAITVLGDQSYSVVELGHACRQCEVRLIAPLRLDRSSNARQAFLVERLCYACAATTMTAYHWSERRKIERDDLRREPCPLGL